eukprot:gene17268-18994_t
MASNPWRREGNGLIKFLIQAMTWLLFSSILFQAVDSYPLKPTVRWSRIRKGSKVLLIGIPMKDYEGTMQITWYKESMNINAKNTERYVAIKNHTQLVIHDFQFKDVGLYYFFCSGNTTNHDVIFHLEMFPEEEPMWYSKGSNTTGTIIGMAFLLLMLLTLVYYCCSKDNADNGLNMFPMKQPMTIPNSRQNGMDFKYSGVKFTTQVNIHGNTGMMKKPGDVRRDSLVSLGLQSKANRSSVMLKKSQRKRKASTVVFL